MAHGEDLLSEALATLSAGVSERRLAELAASLRARYRTGAQVAAMAHDEAVAYCAYRMPATFGAARAALSALRAAAGGDAPRTMLDVGGGAGSAAMAAVATWPSLAELIVLDADREMLAAGRALGAAAPGLLPAGVTWERFDLRAPGVGAMREADLVVVSYVLGELDPDTRDKAVRAALGAGRWVVFVEPGTPEGTARVLEARRVATASGLEIAAPCPHALQCPMEEAGDWCHFSARVSRSALHRRLKSATLGHEDEKFAYVAASRTPLAPARARIVRHPTWRRSVVGLRLCLEPPGLETRMVPKSAGDAYRLARRSAWGDAWAD